MTAAGRLSVEVMTCPALTGLLWTTPQSSTWTLLPQVPATHAEALARTLRALEGYNKGSFKSPRLYIWFQLKLCY